VEGIKTLVRGGRPRSWQTSTKVSALAAPSVPTEGGHCSRYFVHKKQSTYNFFKKKYKGTLFFEPRKKIRRLEKKMSSPLLLARGNPRHLGDPINIKLPNQYQIGH
jgi:hypothetical protein